MAKHVNGSFADLATEIQSVLRRHNGKLTKVVAIVVDAAYKDADEMLSGRTKTSTLRKENHPYGIGSRTPKGKRRARRPALPINEQSGRLRRGLYRRSKRVSRETIHVIGIKPTEYSKYILSPSGTPKMRTRPLWRYVQGRYKGRMTGLRSYVRKVG